MSSYNDHERDARISRVESDLRLVQGARGEDKQNMVRMDDRVHEINRRLDAAVQRLDRVEQQVRDQQERIHDLNNVINEMQDSERP